jgi:hypothetical protein
MDFAIGCQPNEEAPPEPKETPDSFGKVVSRDGIEPSTRRLRVASNARNSAKY